MPPSRNCCEVSRSLLTPSCTTTLPGHTSIKETFRKAWTTWRELSASHEPTQLCSPAWPAAIGGAPGRTKPAACTVAITAARDQQLRADPRNVAVRANLAYLYAEIGDHSEAGRQIYRALEDAPDNVRVRFTSSLVFELTGQRNAALDALRSAIDGGDPKYQVAHHPDLRALRTDDRYVLLVGSARGQ